MLASITPLGERGRGRIWWRTATAYVVGSIAGGLAIGALAGGLGALAHLDALPAAASVAAVCVVAIAADMTRTLPTTRRQVDEAWLVRYRGWVCGIGFGAQLGVGVSTIVTTAAVYAAIALAALTGDVAAGALVGGCIGLVRAQPVVAARRATTPDRLRTLHHRLETWDRPAAWTVTAAELAVATAVLVAR